MLSRYVSPLVSRYASYEMGELFSPNSYARSWRTVWLALAQAQHELGAPVTAEQLAAMRATEGEIDLARVAQIESQTRHDVMAHVIAWGERCPEARPVIHLGATSQFVNDNGEALIHTRALGLIRDRLVNTLRALASFAQRYRDQACLGYTHFQPAQAVTLGKRACTWLDDLVLDLSELNDRVETMPCRGAKGTTGTQASYLDLLGSVKKVRALDQRIAELLGFSRSASVTGQSLSRKHDLRLLDVLCGIAVSLAKFGRDLRLLMHTGVVREPFKRNQVGSSAMPYKRNPILAERLCSLARIVMHQRNGIAEMASTQWLERSLDDSAQRRIAIPEAFMACDGMLRVALELAAGVQVDEQRCLDNLRPHLPFLAVERILSEVVKGGGDRQAAHERLRQHAMGCYGDPSISFDERLLQDEMFAFLEPRLAGLMEPSALVGMASAQVDHYLEDVVRPVLRRHRDIPALADALSV